MSVAGSKIPGSPVQPVDANSTCSRSFIPNRMKIAVLCRVAKNTMFKGFQPSRPTGLRKPHLVAVVAFDGVVLCDLATPCEIFGRVRDSAGRPCYEVRICSL